MSKLLSANPVKIEKPEEILKLSNNTIIEYHCVKCNKVFQTTVYVQKKKLVDKRCLCRSCLTKQTCLEKYGVDSVLKTDKVKNIVKSRDRDFYQKRQEKSIKTKIEKYGSLEEANRRMVEHQRAVMLQTYGIDNIFKDKEYIKQKCFEKFGRDNFFKGEEGKQAAEEGMLKKYGVKRALQKEEFKEKLKQTSLERYGVENYGILEEHTEKMKNTNFQKFGTYHAPSHNYKFDELSFDSSWELAFYIYCRDFDIQIEREVALEYYYKGKRRHYMADFRIRGSEYIEIKGGHFLDDANNLRGVFGEFDEGLVEAKNKCMKENNVRIISDKEIKPYLKYVKEKYGKDYLKSFRKV